MRSAGVCQGPGRGGLGVTLFNSDTKPLHMGIISILQIRKLRPREAVTVEIGFEPRSASAQSTFPHTR